MDILDRNENAKESKTMKTVNINKISSIVPCIGAFKGIILSIYDDNMNVVFSKEYKTFSAAKAQETKILNRYTLYIGNGTKVYRDRYGKNYYQIVEKYGKDCFIVNCFENGQYTGGKYMLRNELLKVYGTEYKYLFYIQ